MIEFLEKLLGPNWRVKVSGWLTTIFTAIYINPELISSLPDAWEKVLVDIAGLVAITSGATWAGLSKDSSVTGGKKAATHEAQVRIEFEREKFQ